MTRRRAARRGAGARTVLGCAAVTAVTALAGCGVRPQADPVVLDVPTVDGGTRPAPGGERLVLPVYLVRDGRLVAVERGVPAASVQVALDQLTAGPTRQEVDGGVRTALTPQRVAVAVTDPPPPEGSVVLAADRSLDSVPGGDQLLAIGQLVWTVTAMPGVDSVHLAVEGSLVEVPTDAGLDRGPVDRSDYRSIAPLPPSPVPPSPGSASPGGPPTGSATVPGRP
ncbi:GerMN domain-containing protein [Kineococcus sp. SYSU DK004]|uniref:GerMN domain-containing protein n=1 Tax=Kineococcus sp. SYSU DK004 TaxID=3383125 RepID=UPI003D7CF15F